MTLPFKVVVIVTTLLLSMEDSRAVMPSQSPGVGMNMDLVNAIGGLVDKCNQVSTDGPTYRKLRLFSESKLIPPSEKEYDAKMEQATQMISESQCSDAIKRRSNVESLKGHAADIVRLLKDSHLSATAT